MFCSFAIASNIPLTKRPDFGVEYSFASSTYSFIVTTSCTLP